MTQHPDELSANHKPGSKNRWRKLWLTAHRWLGLTVGLLFVLIGLTGSILVFDHAIDEWLNPELLLTEKSGETQPVSEIIAAAEAGYAGGEQSALSLSKPRVENGVWSVWFSSGTPEVPTFTAVHVDPYTANVTGERVWGEYLMSWIYRLHFRLVAGVTGGIIVGVVGIMMLISVCSGIVLWWPLWKNGWRAAFAIRSGPRFNYDLHKTIGIAASGLLLILAFTGIYMEFPQTFNAAIEAVAETTESPEDLKTRAPKSSITYSPDEAIVIAQKLYPDARFDHMHPMNEHGVYEVAFRQDGEVQTTFGRTQVFVDGHTGEILATYTPSDFTAADVFRIWQFPLHSGEAFGLFGRLVVFLTGLTPAVLYVTGFLMWWRRRKSRNTKRKTVQADTQHDSISSHRTENSTSPRLETDPVST